MAVNYVGMLRVKNEARWIRHALESLRFCVAVYVFDDHSTDDTPMIAGSVGADVVHSPFQGFNEIRDKNYILAYVQSRHQHDNDMYVVHIDGDEALERDARQKLDLIIEQSNPVAISLQVYYLWDAPNTVRIDGVYGRFFRPSVMRLPKQPVSFSSATHNVANLHCSNVIAEYLAATVQTDIRIWHYGYMDRSDRIRKYEWYNQIDPGNQFEDLYRHVVIGDLFSPSCIMLHGGPLTLRRRQD